MSPASTRTADQDIHLEVCTPLEPAGPWPIPTVFLLDASNKGIDDRGLQRWARELSCLLQNDPPQHTSRSYRYPYALVGWHQGRIGVDIERVEEFDDAFIESIASPQELADPSLQLGNNHQVAALWSGKEALTKALGDSVAYHPRRVAGPSSWPDGRAGNWRAAPLTVPASHVGWVCWESIR